MPYEKKTAKEKLLDSKGLPKIEKISPKQEKVWGKGTIVIPAPVEVDEIMRNVPKGRIITINKIRERLARKHKATIGCPICTGIFASISARAAEEDRESGATTITPWWRTLKEGGVLNPKYPGGEQNQKKLLENEGFEIIKKGKRYVVNNFERYLMEV
jgi:hypothetical protein